MAVTWEKVEIDNMMSWLSTLGGGFSSLGDSFERCVSLKRFYINCIDLVIKMNNFFFLG